MSEEIISKINETLKVAVRSNFYQKKGIKDSIELLEEFRKIPITTKEELRECSAFDVLCVDVEFLKEYHETSGTTGVPISVWYTKNDIEKSGARINEEGVKFMPEDIVIMRFPYAISLPAHIFSEAINQKGATIIPVSRGSNVTPYRRVIDLIYKLKATIIACNPYEVIVLSEVSRAMGYDIKKDFNIRAICTAGEMLSEERRQLIKEIWGAEVYNYYGMTETANIAGSCDNGNLHRAKTGYYLEVLDEETGEPLGYGKKGILCVTQLDKEAFPLIRYNTGDIVELRKSTCSCGNENDILVHLGRKADEIVINDIGCTMGEFQKALYSCNKLTELKMWKIKVTKDKLIIYIENEVDKLNENTKLDLPFNNEIVLVKRGELENIDSLLKNTELNKANYFIKTK